MPIKIASHAVLVLIVMLVVMLNLTGCSDYYKKMSVTDGIAHFSFEYPSNYKPEFQYLDDAPYERTRVGLFTINEESWVNVHEAGITVAIEKTGKRYSNSTDALEAEIKWWTSRGYKDFLLLERSKVIFAGVQSEQIVYSYTYMHIEDVQINMHVVKTPTIVRIIFFDYHEQIWFISVEAHGSYANQSKADFDHILQTFKILE
jgi:hypothetical protein